VAVMVEGDRDCALVDVGESAEDPPRLTASSPPDCDERDWPPPGCFGLSLPVGPLPSGARLAGGKFKAARRLPFSSSSSATRCSRAYVISGGGVRLLCALLLRVKDLVKMKKQTCEMMR
jgi:hypothetical protein